MPMPQSQRQSQRAGPSRRRTQDVAEGEGEQSTPRKSPRKKPGKKRDENTESDEDQVDTPLHDPKIKKQKVDDMIRYFLMASQTQKAVQRVDVVKNCLGKEYGQLFNELLEITKHKMHVLFGIDILQSDEKRGFFYLSNALRHTDFLKVNKEQSAKDALLYAILSNIFMQNPEGKEIGEDAFMSFLQNLGIQMVDNKTDAVFGDVKKLITKTFVEQGWLAVRRETNDTFGTEMSYAWGWRSRLVLSRSEMLTFVAEFMFDGHQGRLLQDHRAVAEQEDEALKVVYNREDSD